MIVSFFQFPAAPPTSSRASITWTTARFPRQRQRWWLSKLPSSRRSPEAAAAGSGCRSASAPRCRDEEQRTNATARSTSGSRAGSRSRSTARFSSGSRSPAACPGRPCPRGGGQPAGSQPASTRTRLWDERKHSLPPSPTYTYFPFPLKHTHARAFIIIHEHTHSNTRSPARVRFPSPRTHILIYLFHLPTSLTPLHRLQQMFPSSKPLKQDKGEKLSKC